MRWETGYNHFLTGLVAVVAQILTWHNSMLDHGVVSGEKSITRSKSWLIACKKVDFSRLSMRKPWMLSVTMRMMNLLPTEIPLMTSTVLHSWSATLMGIKKWQRLRTDGGRDSGDKGTKPIKIMSKTTLITDTR